jgi:uncharacterized protein
MQEIKKRVLIAGGTGFVGQALRHYLQQAGYEVAILSRQPKKDTIRQFGWSPNHRQLGAEAIAWANAVVNLAGERITEGRWTPARKQQLIGSRLTATRLLVRELLRCQDTSKVFVSASAYGVYGEQGNTLLTEETPPIPKANFLADLCQQWEQAAQEAEVGGVRTVLIRIGLVLSDQEGILAGLTKPLRFGVAAPFGSGQQMQSWIHIIDLCGLIEQAIRDSHWRGPVNAVAPRPVTNRELVETLAAVQHKRIWLPRIPVWLLRWRLGEKSDFLLASHRLSAGLAQQLGYTYQYPTIQKAIQSLYAN